MANAQAAYLDPNGLLTRWGNPVTRGTLANWRTKGEGPPYVKFGARVRYPLDKLIKWEAQNSHLVHANDNQLTNTEQT